MHGTSLLGGHGDPRDKGRPPGDSAGLPPLGATGTPASLSRARPHHGRRQQAGQGRMGGGAPTHGRLDVAQISSPPVVSRANLETHQTGNSTAGGAEPGLMPRKPAPRPPEPNYPLPSRPAAPPGWGQPDAPEAGGPPLPRPQCGAAAGTRQARRGARWGSRSQDWPGPPSWALWAAAARAPPVQVDRVLRPHDHSSQNLKNTLLGVG